MSCFPQLDSSSRQVKNGTRMRDALLASYTGATDWSIMSRPSQTAGSRLIVS
jgi:hypothetical protein